MSQFFFKISKIPNLYFLVEILDAQVQIKEKI